MKAVYPVTLQNAPLYSQLAKLFEKMGPNRDHELYIVTCPAALETAQEFAQSCKKLFLNVEIGVVTNIVEKGNAARNQMFREAVYLLEKNKNRSAWIWMENAYPVDIDWLTMIQEEYNAMPRDRFYLGCKAQAFLPATDVLGKPIKAEDGGPLWRPSSDYMRFGVYPHDFHLRSVIFKHVSNLPFEIAIRDEVVPVCQDSKTLATLWASRNYSCQSNGVRYTGEQSPEYEPAIRRNENITVSTDGVAVLHGCRDGSLGMVLMGKHWSRSESRAKKAVASKPSGDLESKLANALAEIEALRARIKDLESPIILSEKDPVISDNMTDTSTPVEITGESIVEPVEVTVTEAKEPDNAPAKPRKRGRPKRIPILA